MKKPQARKPAQKAAAPEKEIVQLPESVLVGPFRFQIRLWPKSEAIMNSALGACNKNDNIIVISEDLNAQTTAEVLLHEVFHAMFHASGLEHVDKITDEEEAIVTQLTMGLLTVMRHNPNFMPLIAKLLELDH